VAGSPPKAWGGFSHPHTAGMGVAEATPISFFYFFQFLSSFQKKNPKIYKTASFWTNPKWRNLYI
jgi:hypothetical protein